MITLDPKAVWAVIVATAAIVSLIFHIGIYIGKLINKLDRHGWTLSEHKKRLDRHEERLDEHDDRLRPLGIGR